MPRTAAPYRPRVAPETRRLLTAAAIALATLWGLARLRFPDTPVTSSPVPPLLAQLAPPPTFEQLASEVSRVRSEVENAIVSIRTGDPDDATPRAALRIKPGIAATILPVAARHGYAASSDVVSIDPATGLALVRMRDGDAPDPPRAWTPQTLDAAQFLLATETSPDGQTSFVPVFVGGLRAESSRAWRDSLWRLPPGTRATPDEFVFTTRGELVGVTVNDGAGLSIVPAGVLRSAAERLIDRPAAITGWLGIDVGPLTPALARATGVTEGVIVSWVDARGPAAGSIAPGDVIESVDSDVIASTAQWTAATARLTPGAATSLHVRSNGHQSDVMLTAAPPPPPAPPVLGLRLRRVPQIGSEVRAVDAGSAAERSGLEAGDVITRAGAILSPSPSEVRAAFHDATPGRPLLLAVSRGTEHRIIAVEP